jgi:hypothetical protein
MADEGNLDTKLECDFKLSFTMAKLGNLDAVLWSFFNYVS